MEQIVFVHTPFSAQYMIDLDLSNYLSSAIKYLLKSANRTTNCFKLTEIDGMIEKCSQIKYKINMR